MRSPCARWAAVDRAVHVRLAASLAPHRPEVARRLHSTSPHFAEVAPVVRPVALHPAVALPVALIVARGAIAIERFRAR